VTEPGTSGPVTAPSTTPAPSLVAEVVEVDATGLSCPMPVIELAKAVRELELGQVVRLLATDPAAKVDVPVWCRMQRQRLRAQTEHAGVWHFEVERVR
jgi:tRNA 2-thiouridine synthesizing protein A